MINLDEFNNTVRNNIINSSFLSDTLAKIQAVKEYLKTIEQELEEIEILIKRRLIKYEH